MVVMQPSEHRRRADAERNMTSILEAGRRCFARNPSASMTEIAQDAGVGRVTLYGHFSSREELLQAVLRQAIDDGMRALDEAAPEVGEPMEALLRVADRCWPVLESWMGLRTAALHAFGESAVRGAHGEAMDRLQRLIVRGQAAGAFRSDVPASWLVATCFALMHAAQDEVDAGRLSPSEAAPVVSSTLRQAMVVEEERGTRAG
jgi:AcrR family transcriptional regulator